MNGSYYAFQAIGRQFGMGNSLMYLFAVVQGIYMLAQLAVILDASTRVFLSDVAKRFMPRQLTKMNEDGLPINGYWMTTILCALIMALGALCRKSMTSSTGCLISTVLSARCQLASYSGLIRWFGYIRIGSRRLIIRFLKIEKSAWLSVSGC